MNRISGSSRCRISGLSDYVDVADGIHHIIELRRTSGGNASLLSAEQLIERRLRGGQAFGGEGDGLRLVLGILDQTGLQNLLVTLGGAGMCLFESKQQTIHHIPVFNRSDVFDVTGAGDTVVATLTLALASGASFLEASILGNLAASLVVRHYGTATTSPEELSQSIADTDWETLLPKAEYEALLALAQ